MSATPAGALPRAARSPFAVYRPIRAEKTVVYQWSGRISHGGDGGAPRGPRVPQVPVRQWVLSLPKRLRYFLHHDPALIGPVLRFFLEAVEDWLKASSPGAPPDARFGVVTFVNRFGSALNANLHFDEIPPCISPIGSLPRSKSAPGRFVIVAVIDGVFGSRGAISRSSAALSGGHRRRATRGANACAPSLRPAHCLGAGLVERLPRLDQLDLLEAVVNQNRNLRVRPDFLGHLAISFRYGSTAIVLYEAVLGCSPEGWAPPLGAAWISIRRLRSTRCGAGIVTSSTPFWKVHRTSSGLTPSGSGTLREKRP